MRPMTLPSMSSTSKSSSHGRHLLALTSSNFSTGFCGFFGGVNSRKQAALPENNAESCVLPPRYVTGVLAMIGLGDQVEIIRNADVTGDLKARANG